jgi:hypothetical protein
MRLNSSVITTLDCGCQQYARGGALVLRCLKHELEELAKQLGCDGCALGLVTEPMRVACSSSGAPHIVLGECLTRQPKA